MRLENKRALVTAAGAGIGREGILLTTALQKFMLWTSPTLPLPNQLPKPSAKSIFSSTALELFNRIPS